MSFILLKHDAGMDELKTFLECPFSRIKNGNSKIISWHLMRPKLNVRSRNYRNLFPQSLFNMKIS